MPGRPVPFSAGMSPLPGSGPVSALEILSRPYSPRALQEGAQPGESILRVRSQRCCRRRSPFLLSACDGQRPRASEFWGWKAAGVELICAGGGHHPGCDLRCEQKCWGPDLERRGQHRPCPGKDTTWPLEYPPLIKEEREALRSGVAASQKSGFLGAGEKILPILLAEGLFLCPHQCVQHNHRKHSARRRRIRESSRVILTVARALRLPPSLPSTMGSPVQTVGLTGVPGHVFVLTPRHRCSCGPCRAGGQGLWVPSPGCARLLGQPALLLSTLLLSTLLLSHCPVSS
ncbi:uncharacterized protein LOC115895473 [Rhinopithecus roxellana]|uniref:uncharacterized protein LOC115895473 n=1 Tax=Rhinopithecus roxellana TaxID=61622 RepID=UPI001237472E|nr:uncharacterized protein LOC115895473 [Rhinopithecus roxellana]